MMVLLAFSVTTLLILGIKCSMVVDMATQKGLHIADYCPKMDFCAEGTHVMCMYYNPVVDVSRSNLGYFYLLKILGFRDNKEETKSTRVKPRGTASCSIQSNLLNSEEIVCGLMLDTQKIMGSKCSNPKNVSITPILADKLLEVTNALRSRIAMGTETGKHGDLLPRGYGMFKLSWDNELATFAQVLANQCVLKHDMCRATKRFPDPGQTAGLVRFSSPDWYPVSKAGHFDTPGLSDAKISYAITQIIKSWYAQKSSVTPNMIAKYPDYSYTPSPGGQLYLEMIDGSATHMGCGISAYSESVFYDNRPNANYNSIQVVCNYSSRPRKGSMVYNTAPPRPQDRLSEKCGCTLTSKEVEGCLCQSYEAVEPTFVPNLSPAPRQANNQMSLRANHQRCPDNDSNCEPTVVLLPIFTVEDHPAPGNNDLRDWSNRTESEKKSMDIFEIFDKHGDHSHKGNILKSAIDDPHNEIELPKLRSSPLPLQALRKPARDVKNRYFDNHEPEHATLSKASARHGIFNKKSSIFTRAEQFHLPAHKNSYDPFEISINEDKKDVPARKDFTHVQNLIKGYLSNRHDVNAHTKTYFSDHERSPTKALIPVKSMGNTETYLKNAEEGLINYNDLFRRRNSTTEIQRYSDIENINEETDNKLLKLLDNLEQEVKHTELHDHEKDIFDAKIRKIYGKVVGNPIELLTRTQTDKLKEMEPDFLDNELKDIASKHKPISSLHPDTNEVSHNQSDLRYDDRVIKSVENEKGAIDDVDSGLNGQRHKYNTYNNRLASRSRSALSRYHKHDFKENRFSKLHSNEDYKARDYDRNKYEFETKNRNTYFNERSTFRNRDFEMPKHRSNSHDGRLKKMNYYLNNDVTVDDPLSVERRRYYQDKLDNLENRLHNDRGVIKRRNEQKIDHHTRRIRPPIDDMQMRPSRSKNQMDSLYLADRARFLDGL